MKTVVSGSSVSHTAGSGIFTVSKPGTYAVAFHGNCSPASGASFPLTVSLSLQLGGSTVPGGTTQHTFSASSNTATLSFTTPVQITTVPAQLQVTAQGQKFLYSIISLTIYKLTS
ncbi:MAG: hypothetical protein ACLUOI_11275 [Eisenbergiella sp.]